MGGFHDVKTWRNLFFRGKFFSEKKCCSTMEKSWPNRGFSALKQREPNIYEIPT